MAFACAVTAYIMNVIRSGNPIEILLSRLSVRSGHIKVAYKDYKYKRNITIYTSTIKNHYS